MLRRTLAGSEYVLVTFGSEILIFLGGGLA